MIINTAHIVNSDPNDFSEEIYKAISRMQGNGLKAEVHYQTIATSSEHAYTAVILGRKKEVAQSSDNY